MNSKKVLFLLFLVFVCPIFGVVGHSESSQCQQTIHLSQKDFESGTYRIKIPGIYVLDENIEFSPIPVLEATRTDMPLGGWFAAITVETNNVVIDLNGKILEASQYFLDNRIFKVYANIELDNSPFSGILFGNIGTSFQGDLSFVSANNVLIKNGVLGRSSHWGLHGNNNTEVTAHHLKIKDFEVAGIELKGLFKANFSDIKMTGLEHVINVSILKVAADTLIDYLIVLANQNVPGACDHLASLLQFVQENPILFNSPLLLPESNYYGMIFGSGFDPNDLFPVNPESCSAGALLSGGRTVEQVKLENIHIEGLKTNPREFVLIGGNTDNTIISPSRVGVPVFGSSTWDSAFNPQTGAFDPNPLLQAQIFVINRQLLLHPERIVFLPSNYPAISDSIVSMNENEFLNNTVPIFGRQVDGVGIKGVFGIRMDCAKNIHIKNCNVCNLSNVGAPGTELSEIPDGEFYKNLIQQPYRGNDAWGFESGNLHQSTIRNCSSSKISSINGSVFALDLIGSDGDIVVKKCKSIDIFAFGDNTTSNVNLPSEVYGFRAQNNSGPIQFTQCKSKRIYSPRFAFGFAAEESDGVQFSFCEAQNLKATSSRDLSSPKQAFGFDLESANNTILKYVSVNNVQIKGEKKAEQSASIAAGIFIDSGSKNTTIIRPEIKGIDGGAGEAFKIDNLGENTTIKPRISRPEDII